MYKPLRRAVSTDSARATAHGAQISDNEPFISKKTDLLLIVILKTRINAIRLHEIDTCMKITKYSATDSASDSEFAKNTI